MEVRGQFTGHYLSALAFAAKSTGRGAFSQRGAAVVASLAECQAAWGDGYLAAFPKSFLDRLEALEPVWAPLYVLHKILAGLLDQHQLAAQPLALGVATGLADFLCARFDKVVADKGRGHWAQVLETEFGGMNEVRAPLRGVRSPSGAVSGGVGGGGWGLAAPRCAAASPPTAAVDLL